MRERKVSSGNLRLFLRRFLPAFIALSAVALILLGISVVQSFRAVGKGKTELISLESGSAAYDHAGTSLAVATNDRAELISAFGKVLSHSDVNYASPACCAGEKLSVFYDKGAPGFRAVYPDGSVFNAETDYPVINACVNKNGILSVIYAEGEEDYSLMAYSADLTALFRVELHSATPKLAAVSENNILCLAYDTPGGGVLHFCPLDSSEETGHFEATGDTFTHLEFLDANTLVAATDHRLFFLDCDGRAFDEISFGKLSPVAVTVSPELVAVATKSSSGSSCSITVLDRIGNIVASQSWQKNVLGISAAENTLLVLFEDESTLFTPQLEEIVSYQQGDGVSQVFLCSGRRAIFAGPEGADLIDFGRE